MFRRILVPVDGSEPALRAARLALDMASAGPAAREGGRLADPRADDRSLPASDSPSERPSVPPTPADVVLLTVVPVPQSLVLIAGVEGVIEEYVETAGREALAGAEAVFAEAGVGVESKIEVGGAAEAMRP